MPDFQNRENIYKITAEQYVRLTGISGHIRAGNMISERKYIYPFELYSNHCLYETKIFVWAGQKYIRYKENSGI
jgi:hypothetical protein